MSVQFNPESPVGEQLKKNLVTELIRKFNINEDAEDIADYISVLIANGNSPPEIVKEVNDISDSPIDIEFINSVFIEIERLGREYEQLQQQPQQTQQIQPEQQQVQPQPVESQVVQPAQPVQVPVQAPAPAQPQLPQPQQPVPQFVFDPSKIPNPNLIFSQGDYQDLQSIPTGPRSGLVGRLPTGPKAHDRFANTRGGRGGIAKGPNRMDRTKKPYAMKNAENMEKMLGMSNSNTNVTQFVQKTSKGRCTEFPYCNNKECEFAHPTKNCFAYPNCTNPPGTCNYLHPDQDQELIAKLEKSKKDFHEKKKNDYLVTQGSCKFAAGCTKDTCPFAHPTPANPQAKINTLDWCSAGKVCADPQCVKAHPPPSTAKPVVQVNQAEFALEQCKFGPACTNYKCPRRHATSLVPCRAGTTCKRLDCTFAHPLNEVCRFGDKCQNKNCMYQHPAGREIQSNTWSKGSEPTNSRAFAVPDDQIMEQAVQE